MASMKFSNDSDEYKMFGEFYQLVQRHYVFGVEEKYWEDLTQEVQQFVDKWQSKVELARELGYALVKYEERMWKDGCDG